MIRKATEVDFTAQTSDECGMRIHSLRRAYGIEAPFVRFYADEYGNLLSIMDGVAVLCSKSNFEEWAVFVHMNPDVLRIHCSVSVARILLTMGNWQGREGVVLKYEGEDVSSSAQVCENPYLPDVHALLTTCFADIPPLNAWYPDASHRLRHDCAKIATIIVDNRVVSTAMTVAETDTSALIGQVATHSDYRGRGYAKTCINSLISRCEGKSLYILPMTDIAHRIYTNMGFCPCGEWAELQRI